MEKRSTFSTCFFMIIFSFVYISDFSVNAATSVRILEPNNQLIHVLPEVGSFGYTVQKMNVFCYKGQEKDFSKYLLSISLNIEIDSDDFSCFKGDSAESVQEAYQDHNSIFSLNLLSRNKRQIMINPFNATCIGIAAAEEYKIALRLIPLDLIKLAMLITGIIIFFSASKLSHNDIFYYLSGVSLGNVASLLVLIWFISKLFPRKPLMYGVLASGWTLAAYLGQILADNIKPILISYKSYVILYIVTASAISFAFCYYKGPPKNIRSKNLIKWALQGAGLVSIFFSSEYREASATICAVAIALYFFPTKIFGVFVRLWRRKFPPKRKLLSKEEFEEQARIETEKALKELREFVRSPECKNQWKLVKNLTDPMRFASFVEGDDHVTLDETMEHENSLAGIDFSDDEDDLSDDTLDESVVFDEHLQQINKSKLSNGSRNFKTSFTSRVSSSTPNGSIRMKQKKAVTSRLAQSKNNFEMSDDE